MITARDWLRSAEQVAARLRERVPEAERPLWDAELQARCDMTAFGRAEVEITPEVAAAYVARLERLAREQARRLRAEALNHAGMARRGGNRGAARNKLNYLLRLPAPRRLP